MEQPSYNDVLFNNSSDPFVNGGQQAASGSSSSTGSSNGTPSHSYKGSFTPSSPSSDEFSASLDANGRPITQLPLNTPYSFSHNNTEGNLNDRPKLNNNTANTSVSSKYANIAQNTPNFSHSSPFNQSVFTNPVSKVSHFDGIGEMNSLILKDDRGRLTGNAHADQETSNLSSSQQLPESKSQQPNLSSFFSNSIPANSESPIPPATIVMTANQCSVSANVYSINSSSVNSAHQNYAASTISSQSFRDHISNVKSKPNVLLNHSGSFQQQVHPAAALPKPTLVRPEQASSEAHPLPVNAVAFNASQQSAPSQFLVQSQASLFPKSEFAPSSGLSQSSMPMHQSVGQNQRIQSPYSQSLNARPTHSAYSSAISKSNVPLPIAANPAVSTYQNTTSVQNSLSFPATQKSIVNRSHAQSPVVNRSNVNMINSQTLSLDSKQIPGGHAGFQNYPASQEPEMPFQSSMANLMPSGINRTYERSGQSTVSTSQPEHSYGPQYSSVPPQMNNRYAGLPGNEMSAIDGMTGQFSGMNVVKHGYYGSRGIDSCNLLRMRDILPMQKIEAPCIQLPPELPSDCNCDPDVFRCTLIKVPESKNLLDKSRLPLGILLHPFRDLTNLSVIQCSTIVRCRSCRTYINPFVYFMDSRHWKCNLCFRANDLPDDFRYNPSTKMNDDPLRRPEVRNATIEFIASSEYMVRPPQPAMYMFVLDVSRIATQTGYLSTVCETLSANLGKLPGDSRTSVGFITVDSSIRFYDLGENLNQPHELIVTDVDDVFIPFPENLIVNLHEQFELIKDLLERIPEKFKESFDNNCALGAALQAAHKLMAPTGGRVTVFASCLPNYGPGALKPREEVAQRSNNNIHLNPATDFYKKLALECNNVHVAIDLFVVNAQYVDLATISGISQISGGCMHHFPLYNSKNSRDVDKLVRIFERYLTRKIGFEAVMRLRCTKGLSIHSFHGNCFVRTTDLLALPNINPDAGFGMQVSIDESLSDLQNVCFQAALLYTSSKGERRIRVHTLCLPVTNNLHDVLVSADQQCIAGLLAKMAVDRSLHSSVADAREAFVNVVCDILNAYKLVSSSGQAGSLVAPHNLALFPLYILGLLKSVAFRLGPATRTDDRVFSMYQMKCVPLDRLIQIIYPDLYAIHNLPQQPQHEFNGRIVPIPPIIQLSAERIDSTGVYLLDEGESMTVFIGHSTQPAVCQTLFGYPQFSSVPDNLDDFPVVESQENKLTHNFIMHLQTRKPNPVVIDVLKDTIQMRTKFYERLVDDKTEYGISYYEFLQNVSSQMN